MIGADGDEGANTRGRDEIGAVGVCARNRLIDIVMIKGECSGKSATRVLQHEINHWYATEQLD